jgi:TolA-binding protein
MRRSRITWILLLLMLLSACGSRPTIEQDPTIKQLADRAARIEPAALPPMSRQDVQRTYERLAESTANHGLKVIALQRLADLELENEQARLAGEGMTADKAKAAAEVEPAVEEITRSEAAEEEKVQGAIRQYERLLELYPDYAGNDGVMYQLARAYELNGDLDKTLEVLTRLIKQYPDHASREEIQFRRGEILFAFKEFEQAEQAYQNVLSLGPEGSYYERAMFKHGWSVFKQGHTQRSLKSYFAVLDRTFAGGRDLADFSRSELELLDDTLRIVSLSFSYLKGAETVAAFFDEYGARSYEHRVYERLGDLYLSQERIDDAAATFMAFVSRSPQHRQAPLFMVKVIDIYKQAGRPKELLRAKADLVTGYGIGTAFWKSQDAALLTEMTPHLKANLDDLSKYYHAEAQKTKEPKDYRLAAHWYRTYVRSFPKDPRTPNKNLLLAESLQDSGDLAGAATEFENTAYGYPLHDKSAEAGYAALLAHRQQVDSLQGEARLQKRRVAIASSKRFVATFPADKHAVAVMSKAAEELHDLKDYSNAVATAHHVVGGLPLPDRELLIINWAIIAEGEFELGLYPEAEVASLQRLKLAGADDQDRKAHEERLAAAIYKQGEQARAGGDNRSAARHFLRVGQLVPKASIRANADYDAAAALHANGDWALAIPVLKAFVQNYPSHKLRQGADEKLAIAYEKTGDWGRAAGAYEVLYRNATDGNKKRQLLWQMAEFYDKAKRPGDAAEIYKRYVTTFPMPFDEAMEARHRLVTIYKEQGQIQTRHYWLGKIIEADKEGPSTDRSHYLAAMASLELAGPIYEAYRSVHLVLPLKENLKKKKKLMQDSINAYTQAANYGIEAVATASTYRIAEIYSDFSRGLFASERPKGLSEDELEQYDLLLEEQAYPFEEKAIEIHVVNAERTFGGVYDDWVKKSFKSLTKLSPVRYAKSERRELLDTVIE